MPLAFRGVAVHVCDRVDDHAGPRRACTRSPASASGLFALMRSLGGAIGISGLRHPPQRPDQSAFPAYRRASDLSKYRS